MISSTNNFYFKQEEPNQSCLLAMRSIILNQHEDIYETVKWGIPCFMYKKKMFCFLSVYKKSNVPYLLMVEGNRLDHPALEKGDRKRMKILRLDPNNDLPLEIITGILESALSLYGA